MKTGSAPIINYHLDRKNQTDCFSLVSAAAVSSPNGEFGEWNAFPGGQIPASAQSPENSGSDLFGAMATASPTAPIPVVAAAVPAPASADLFDLMGPTQTLTSSQSLNFSMSSTQTLSTNIMPQPVSQVGLPELSLTWKTHEIEQDFAANWRYSTFLLPTKISNFCVCLVMKTIDELACFSILCILTYMFFTSPSLTWAVLCSHSPCSQEWPHKALEPKRPFLPLGPITRLTSTWTFWGLACSLPSLASPASTPSSKVS